MTMKERYCGKWESVEKHRIPQWYEDCKFGIFIHWGLYSVPAFAPRSWELGEVEVNEEWFTNNPYAEWYYNSIRIGKGPAYEYHVNKYGEDFAYEQFADMWKAENWNPKEWAELFKEAGAGYVVLTTKHHDGFCLFPSKYTDFHSGSHGPMRDIVGELTDAVRKEDIRMGLYYSGIIDWQYANDPIVNEEDEIYNSCPTAEYADYAYKQCCELIDTYHPSVLWNDIGWPKQGEYNLPYLLAHYYNTVEDGVVNDRFNGLYKGYSTKEYKQGKTSRSEKWEMCRGMGLSFGYNANEGNEHLISVKDLVSLLVSMVADNGNLLLNIGPKPDGTIPQEQAERLRALGRWLKVNGEGIYGSRCSERTMKKLENGVEIRFTKKGSREYVFLDHLPAGGVEFELEGCKETAVPLAPHISVEEKAEQGRTLFRVSGYKEDDYTVVLKI